MSDEQQIVLTERIARPGGVLDQSWTWVEANWLNLMAGAPAIILTLLLVDLVKGWVKLYLARKLGADYNEHVEDLAVRSLTIPSAFLWVATLDFTRAANEMFGWRLTWPQGMLIGTVATAGLAVALVEMMDYFKVGATLRVRFQRITNVSREQIDAASTVKHSPIPGELPPPKGKQNG